MKRALLFLMAAAAMAQFPEGGGGGSGGTGAPNASFTWTGSSTTGDITHTFSTEAAGKAVIVCYDPAGVLLTGWTRSDPNATTIRVTFGGAQASGTKCSANATGTGATGATGPEGPEGPAGAGNPGGTDGQIQTNSGGTAFAGISTVPATQGGTGQNSSASTGVPRVASGTWSFAAGIAHLAVGNSADLLSKVSDAVGSGFAVFNNSPTIITPTIASLVNATHNHQDAAGGGQLNATSVFIAGTIPTARLGSGSASGTTFLRGDQTWATPPGGGGGITSLGGQTGATQTFGNDANVTMSSATDAHTLGWSGTLSVARGGSGVGTLTGLLQGNGTSAFTGIANSSTTGQALRVTGASTYAWGAIDLANSSAVTGALPPANWTPLSVEGDLIYRNATITTRLARGTNGQCLVATASTIQWGSCTGSAGITSLGGQTGATQTITRGVGIGGSSATDDHAFTVDLSELVNSQTLWDSSQASRTLTAGLSGATDPVLTFANNSFSTNVPVTVPGILTSGGSVAGFLEFTQGTACTPSANSVCFYAPASIGTAYGVVTPSAVGATGVVKVSVSGAVATLSHAALVDADVPNDITVDNATTSTGLASNPTDCSGTAGLNFADTIAASGNLTCQDVRAASTTQTGVAEAAIDTEVTTGTDAARYVTPDALAGSTIFGVKVVEVEIFPAGTAASTGDGKAYYRIPASLNGMNLVSVKANVYTAGTTNTINVDLARCATAATGNVCSGTVSDMLSTNLTIDSGENDTATAAAAAVIDTSNDDVATGQLIRFDIDAIHTTPSQGLLIELTFQLP